MSRRVFHAIDATPARWRGRGGLSLLDSVHPTHWLIYRRSRRGLWRYVRSFLATLLAVASLPDGAAGDAAVAECAVDVADDADDAAVALAAAVFADAGGDDLVAFDDFADWYTDGGYKVASWLELLDLSKWVL